jgi:hypothetical protein
VQIIEVTGLGVRSAAIRLRRRDSALQFVVYPMIHMARPQFYRDVTTRLRRAQLIVVEGVHGGRTSPLFQALTLSYRVLRFNRRVQLVEQNIDYQALGVPIIHPDVSAGEFRADWRRVPWRGRMLMWLVLPVVIVARLFGGTGAIWTRALALDDQPSPEEEAMAEVMPEVDAALLDRRDQRLLTALYALHEQRCDEAIEVAVVYGAAHVPAIVHGLADKYGYQARSADWLTVADV